MTCEPHWTAYLTAYLTPIVAFFGIYIAYRQWRTAENKLKHELFDRRFSVYDAARTFLMSIPQIHEPNKLYDAQLSFVSATREAKWLLDTTVADYLHKECYGEAEKFRHLLIDIQRSKDDSEETKTPFYNKKDEIGNWFFQQYDVLDEYFSPFLKLQHSQHPRVCGKFLDLIKKTRTV